MIIKMEEEKDYEEIEPGIYQAVCSKIFDIGMQDCDYNGEHSKKHKLIIIWELDKRIENGEYAGQRIVKSKQYTASLYSKATLTKDLIGWRGRGFTGDEIIEFTSKGFDFNKLIGKNCMLSLQEIISKTNGKKYIVIGSISPKMKQLQNITPELPDDWCPDWIKNKMPERNGAQEFVDKNFTSAGDYKVPNNEDFEDDIPF